MDNYGYLEWPTNGLRISKTIQEAETSSKGSFEDFEFHGEFLAEFLRYMAANARSCRGGR